MTWSCNRGTYIDYVYRSSVTRLTFTAADGTEYELVDVGTNGALHTNNCTSSQYSRGKVFVSHDGSSATFISDGNVMDPFLGGEPNEINSWADSGLSGYLFLRDGTRYRISNGVVTEIRDRNGNTITFTSNSSYDLIVTDSLNRQVAVNYNYSDASPYGLCDKITFRGYNGATRIIRVSKNSHGKPTAVWLPDDDALHRHYSFSYNSHWELSRVDLPTGGAFEYDWGPGLTGDADELGRFYNTNNGHYEIYRRVLEKRVYADGSTLEGKTVFTSPESCGSDSTCANFTASGYATVDEKDASNSLIARQRHYFNGSAAGSIATHTPISALVDDLEGRETETRSYAADGTTLLRKVVNTWSPALVFGQGPRLTEVNTTLSDTNQVSKETFAYDNYGNRTDSYEYDFGSGTAGSVVRHTQTSYVTTNSVNSAAYDTVNPSTSSPSVSATIHIRSLPAQTSVYDAGGIERARTTFEYDSYATDTNHAGLKDWYTITGYPTSGLDSAYTTSFTTRGNPTATTHYLFNSSGAVTGSISAYAQYDVAGNAVKAIDARGCATTFDFTDRFGGPNGDAEGNTSPTELNTPGKASYAFATKATNCSNQNAYVQFDYYLGMPVDGEDPNGVVSSGYYSDLLDRPTKIIRASNQSTSFQSQTLFSYDDANRIVTTTSDFSTLGDAALVSKGFYDGLGRTKESQQYEDSTHYVAVQTQYDALGRAYKTSNPFRPLSPASESAVWTTSVFDALGRVISITTPDNAVVSSSYSGNTVTATDQTSKSRKSVSDALGRLTSVYEDPSGLNYQTSYSYDVLGDLLTVSQGSQTRTFVYDSLKRLTSAANPESGTVSYTYDNNGNLLTRTDARSITTTIAYDVLNRPTSKSYNDNPQTPTVNFYYDTQTLPSGAPSYTHGAAVGKLLAVTYAGGSTGDYYGFDAIGREVLKIQQTGSVNYQTSASYNVSGALTSETYPSGHTVTNTFDSAGRTSSVTGTLGDSTSRTYSTGILYSSLGGMSKEQFGTTTAIFNKLFYNIRGQLSEIREGTSYTGPTDTGWQRGAIINHYSDTCWGMCSGHSMTDNNGNLKKQEHWIQDGSGNTTATFTQQYDYDSLNRLQRVHDGTTWQQEYTYDRYGNRIINTAGNKTWGTGINNLSESIDTTTNRMYLPGDTSHAYVDYDAAGNQTKDYLTSNGTRAYDAENRMKSATDSSNHTTSYTYDGEGKRVKRNIAGIETWQVYGLGGELVAEYPANGAANAPQKEYGYRNGQLLITATCPVPAAKLTVSSATASSYYTTGYEPAKAIDGNTTTTMWNSGTFAPAWIQLDLGQAYTLSKVRLLTGQYPDGHTTHEVYGGPSPSNLTLLGTVDGNTTSSQWLELTTSATNVRYVKVSTTASPSWIGWLEVEVYQAAQAADVRWLVTDQLGTPRMVFDQSGSLANTVRHDYLPFGEDLAGVGGRTATLGYTGADGARQKFTGYERDTESGLDYAQARYYANMQGRFTSPDPLMASGRLASPQSWNRYSYVMNSPLRLIDPNGLEGKEVRDTAAQGKTQTTAPSQSPQAVTKVDDFELGIPPPPPSAKGAAPIPAQAEIVGGFNGSDSRGRPLSFANSFVIQQIVVIQVTDQYNHPYNATDSEGNPAVVTEDVTKAPGSVEAPGMENVEPTTAPADLDSNGQIADQHRYSGGGFPNELPDNLSAVRRQVVSVTDPNTGVTSEVGHFEIRYQKTTVTITDFTRGKENAKTYTFTPP